MNARARHVRRAVGYLLVFAVMLLAGALMADNSTALEWGWLQERRHGFYVLKGITATTATVLVIAHMGQVWAESMKLGQRLRYAMLFYLVALVAASSVEQVQQDVVVNSRNIGGFLGALGVIVAMVVSIAEAQTVRRNRA